MIARLPGTTVYVVQLYEWLAGAPSNRAVVDLAAMGRWYFYADADDWRAVSNAHLSRPRPGVTRTT